MMLMLALAIFMPLPQEATTRFGAEQVTYNQPVFFLCKDKGAATSADVRLMRFSVNKGRGVLRVVMPQGMGAPRSFELTDPVRYADQRLAGDVRTTVVVVEGVYRGASYKGELTFRAVGEEPPEAALVMNHRTASENLECGPPILLPETTK